MCWDIVITIVSKAAEFFVEPIGRRIGYMLSYSSNVQSLKDEVDKLTLAKDRVQTDVEVATKNGEEVYKDVEAWLTGVNGVTEEAEKIVNDKDDTTKTWCFGGWCPNLKTRYRFSREAEKMREAAVKLREESKFEKVSCPKPPQGVGRVKGFEAFESRWLILENIVEALKDADVHLIGVYGLGGVGKTTLVKEVAAGVKEQGIFKSVAIATVTQTPDVKKIQNEIAEYLGFKIDEDTVALRADRLSKRLKKEEKVMVILDDVWKEIKLEEVGVPCGKDCKILITSRDQNVLSKMDVRRDLRLDVLVEGEAWDLFQKNMGDLKDPEMKPVAIELAKRCGGLPLLIAVVAGGLRNKELYEWKDALTRLKRHDHDEMKETIKSVLELSYDWLKNEEIKSLFLLCGQLWPYKLPLICLLQWVVGLSLFGRSCNTLDETRNRLHAYVNQLKASCLLIEESETGYFTMHDVVGNFALSVASKDHVFHVPRETTMTEWPTKDKLEKYRRIFFFDCKIPDFSQTLECPNLKVFLLFTLERSLKIPDNFFEGMKELNVLDLASVCLSPLPSSLVYLENLQTLSLQNCDLEDIAIIGGLKQLKALCLRSSKFIRLPEEIGNLTNLLLLDLWDCSSLEVIPPNVLSRLTQLEVLHMGDSFVRWEGEAQCSLAELKALPNLVSLDIHIINAKSLSKDWFSSKLDNFRIFVGDNWYWSVEYETSRTLKLNLDTGIRLLEGVKVLLRKTKELHLHELKGIKTILYEFQEEDFFQLEHLHIRNSDLQYVIDSNGRRRSSSVSFQRLESLFLDHLIDLEQIACGPLIAESFSSLRKLNVRNCNKLRNLFLFSVARSLKKIEEIEVSYCFIMEEIFGTGSGDEDSTNDEEIKLAQLHTLTLDHLSQLSSFTSKLKLTSAMGEMVATTSASPREIVSEDEPEIPVPLFNKKITFPNLTDLKLSSIGVEKIWSNQLPQCIQKLTALIIDGCGNLKYLFTYSMIGSLSNLKKLEICDCKSIEEVISVENPTVQIWFPELKFLTLKNVKKLINFCRGNSIECPNLKVLQIEDCPQLKTFISNIGRTDGASSDQSGRTNSALFDEKVVFPKLEELHIMDMHKLTRTWDNEFQADSLKVLKVEHANQLLKIFPERGFKNLETLVVKNCDMIEEVFDDLKVAPTQLRTLELKNLPNLKHVWKWNTVDHNPAVSFDKLSSIIVWHCMSLKSLFPISVARNLQALDVLNIDDCGLEEVVSNDEISEATLEFVFPQLKSVCLWRLKELKCFYSGNHTLECPALQKLTVYKCDRLKIFECGPEDVQDTDEESRLTIQFHQQPLFSFSKVVPQLVELGLNRNDTTTILIQSQFPKLKFLHLHCFFDTSADCPLHLLHIFPNVVHLVLRECNFQEIFPYGIAREDALAVSRIRNLTLNFLPEMRRIWNQDCQVLSDLQSLEILQCDKLINLGLGPDSAYFSNLTNLDVGDCQGLINLVTTSAVKGLLNLTRMTVRDCNMVTEIVVKEGDECQSQSEIIFKKLTSLKLLRLMSLSSFSSSPNCSIKFPSLVEVVVTQCPNMQVFSQGHVSTPKLQKVCLIEGGDKWRWVKDLNTTIQQLSTEMVDMIKGMTPEEIRKTFNIKNDFSPEEEEEVRRENQWAFE